VILARFVAPLFIPRFPLPAILTCLVLDAIDQPIFQTFTHFDLALYQSYDKALDIFYLSIAMLTTLRNWASYPAVQIARGLFYFRLVGVLFFELTHWRPMLLIFANTFEYFFVFYEIVRSRWTPTRFRVRFYAIATALIWIFIKLPQEYWLHVARLDTTDVLKTDVLHAGPRVGWDDIIMHRTFAFVLLLAAGAVLIAVVYYVVHRLEPAPVHPLELSSPPLPRAADNAEERDDVVAASWRLFDVHLVEKIVLVGCITVIFAQILPDVDASPLQLARGAAVVVTINAFLGLRRARKHRSRESAVLSFLWLAVINVGIVGIYDYLLRRGTGHLGIPTTVFFLVLLTLIITLYDRWRPVFETRFSKRQAHRFMA
jgi:hypothetical protein